MTAPAKRAVKKEGERPGKEENVKIGRKGLKLRDSKEVTRRKRPTLVCARQQTVVDGHVARPSQ